MVPLYAISSFISLFSLEAGVIIDVIRDVYEVSPSACLDVAWTDLSVAGVCYLLLLPPSPDLPRRRTVPTHPSLRSRT